MGLGEERKNPKSHLERQQTATQRFDEHVCVHS